MRISPHKGEEPSRFRLMKRINEEKTYPTERIDEERLVIRFRNTRGLRESLRRDIIKEIAEDHSRERQFLISRHNDISKAFNNLPIKRCSRNVMKNRFHNL
jgi:hypothetical protein